jgi:CDGSH-type Zn-finger protein/uncharacterized Fe-S cluster protein YjdI
MTFTPLRALAALPPARAAAFVAERVGQLRERATELPLQPVAGETPATWQEVIGLLQRQQAALLALGGRPALPVPGTDGSTARDADDGAAPVAPPVEVVPGHGLTVIFEARRCIHSRHCVLDAPSVFKANTPGAWIYPDTVPVEQLVAVAHSCPSGAIRYERHEGDPAEGAPAVNQLRVRENGPYAVHAPLRIAGRDDGFRATLCRCGQSKRKPWCDGSHGPAGFQASGEPPTTAPAALAVRDGPLQIDPQRNGPLHVQGNLEICAGTGRTVARTTEARLCRCGWSQTKPFCDLSHIAAGFVADGA